MNFASLERAQEISAFLSGRRAAGAGGPHTSWSRISWVPIWQWRPGEFD